MAEKVAVVVGALGVIGRYIVDHLLARGDWEVVGLSRRTEPDRPGLRYISVDLRDHAECAAKLAEPNTTTHIFYAAFQAAPGLASGYAANIAPNRDMLINTVSGVAAASSKLRRVVLVTGTKTYGVHLGPYKTPARENDPRPAIANYYYDQVDWLSAFQRGKAWDWVELRPQTLCGFAPGTPMSLMPAIAVYATLCKARGDKLHYPGSVAAYDSIYQVTESEHFARAALWAALEPTCSNEAFNITNGDFFRWRHMWSLIAEEFDMDFGDPRPQRLVETMADAGPLWDRIVRENGLKPFRYDEIVAWPFADYVFGTNWDVMSDTTKARQHGFHDVVDSQEMMVRLLRHFRAERIVP
jgi:nucleoside-diphosphate-sugar epimerase